MRTTIIIFSLFVFSTIQAQSPKTIGEILELEEGCPLPKIKKKATAEIEEEDVMIEESVSMSVSPPPPPYPPKAPPPPPPPVPAINMADYAEHIVKIQQQAKLNKVIQKVGNNELFFENELWGLRTAEGKILVKPTFDRIYFRNMKDHFVARKPGSTKCNYYTEDGTELLEKEYDYIFKNVNNPYIQIGNKGLKGATDLSGKVLFEPQFDAINKANDFWLIRKGNLSGIADKNGKILVKPMYEELKAIRIKDSPTQFFAQDKNGNLVIYVGGELVQTLGIPYNKYSEGKLLNGRYLYYNRKLIDIKKKQFLFCGEKVKVEAHRQVKNLFSLTKYPNTYIFNEKGELIIEQPIASRFTSLSFQKGGAPLAIRSDEKNEKGRPIAKVGLIKKDLTWQLEPTYLRIDQVDTFNVYLATNIDKMSGMMDVNGKAIIPFKYLITQKAGNRILAMKSADPNLADVYDFDGKLLFETTIKHRYIRPISVGYEASRLSDRKRVMLNDKFEEFYSKGFNNYGKVGDYAIWIERFDTPKSYEIFDYEGKPYPIMIDGKPRTDYKNIDGVHKTPFFQITLSDGGNYLYNTNTQKAHPINKDIKHIEGRYPALMLKAGKEYRKDKGMIDTLGNEILPPIFNSIGRAGEIMWLTTKERNHFYDGEGKPIFRDYDNVYYLKGDLFRVKKDDKIGVVNSKNKLLIPIVYKKIKTSHSEKLEVTSMDGKKMLFGMDGVKIKDL